MLPFKYFYPENINYFTYRCFFQSFIYGSYAASESKCCAETIFQLVILPNAIELPNTNSLYSTPIEKLSSQVICSSDRSQVMLPSINFINT